VTQRTGAARAIQPPATAPEPVDRLCQACADFYPNQLLVRVGGRWLCAHCWHKAREPWGVGETISAAELQEIENRTRERMTARGGTDRHLVRNGRT
jgi:hypothetical protein